MSKYPITKKKLLSAMKCKLKAWLYMHGRKVGIKPNKPTPQQKRMMQSGIDAENYFRTFKTDGVLIKDGWSYYGWKNAIKETKDAIYNGMSRLYQSAFLSKDNILSLSDEVIIHDNNNLTLNEVKATNSVKEEHILDVAVQAHTVIDSGYNLNDISLTHLNKKAVMEDGENFFTSSSIKDRVLDTMPLIQNWIKEVRLLEQSEKMPEPEYQPGCKDCDFRGHCLSQLPETNILTIPNIHINRVRALQTQRIFDVRAIPEDFPLTESQAKYVETIHTGEILIDDENIENELGNLIYPIHFMDFETYNYSLPIVAETGPWEQVPFQWSIHHLEHSGELTHDEYLFSKSLDGYDIRKEFLDTLLDKLEHDEGSIVVYNASFEKMVLNNLGKRFPDYENRIKTIIGRIWDLEIIFKRYHLDPRFLGRTSLKVIVPTLLTECDYESLNVSNGVDATKTWSDMITLLQNFDGADGSNDMTKILKYSFDLLAYCAMDTLVMVKLFDYLEQLLLRSGVGQLELPIVNQKLK